MTTKFILSTDETKWLEKRKNYVTSTETASLFGLQMASVPTAYELWHIKKGNIERNVPDNNFMMWGRIVEPSIAEIVRQQQPDWTVRPMNAFAYNDKTKMGASYDYQVEIPDRDGLGILEIKTTNYKTYKQKFIEDNNSDFIECPPYYEIQGQQQLHMLSDGYSYVCFVIAILDTREIKYIIRDRDSEMGRHLQNKIKVFYDSDAPPSPDLEKDSDLLARMHKATNSDKAIDLTKDDEFDMMAMAYLSANDTEKRVKSEKKRLKSKIILKMKDGNSAWGKEYRASNKNSFRITKTKKEKK